eukprot:TRINITY_DN32437_c0_g1_i1.p1 TRINITY_DN32437_c0_g1~~TRINITY_DN32437_c0_g1_i1.p1  ORF type:complete len:203 (-),score=32.98 TRINITY_DN32437_c0_g1_i1:35-643(-)
MARSTFSLNRRKMEVQPFFGGAILCGVPQGFVDCSLIREVPDHQEVWVDPHTDSCLIVELLDREADVADDVIARHHFLELAEANQSVDTTVGEQQLLPANEVPGVPAEAFKALVVGRQHVSKFREAARNAVTVLLAVLRLAPPHNTEILISLSAPITLDPESSSARDGEVRPVGGDQVLCRELFDRVLQSFEIRDFSLFQGS